jgi:lysophospholipase L1-like esterase
MVKTLSLIFFAEVMIFSFPACAQITNQNLYDTIPTMPDHYRELREKFRQEPLRQHRIVFLGNSITEGGKWQDLTGDSTVINRGIGGDVTFGILNRLDDIIQLAPSKIFILIGINDIAKDFPDAVIINNYRKIISQLQQRSPTSVIYFQSLFPVNPEYPKFPQHYDKGAHVISVNKFLKKLCAEMNVVFVDLYPLLLKDGNLDPSYTYDGLHLNNLGYKKWVAYLKNKSYL